MLGFLYGKSDLFNSGVHLFFAELETLGTPQIGEGIASILQFTVTEFEDMMRRGEILGSFTVAAYAYAKLYRLI